MTDYKKGLYFGFVISDDEYQALAKKMELIGEYGTLEDNLDFFTWSDDTNETFVGIPVYDVEDNGGDCMLNLNDINAIMAKEDFKKRLAQFTSFCNTYVIPNIGSYVIPQIHLISVAW